MQPTPTLPESGPPPTSLAARLLNIFATPGDVFQEVKVSRPSTGNWLVPALLYGLMGAVAAVLILSNPAVAQQMRESQERMYEKQVDAGKMSQADADRALAAAEKFTGPIAKVAGAIAAVVGGVISVFWWALVLWLIGRLALKAPLDFVKALEVAGLASAISVLDAVVRMLLVFGTSNPLASPSLAMLMKNPDPQNSLFTLLSLANIMTFWVLAVRSIGLAKLAGASFGKTAMWVCGAWVLMMAVVVTVTTVLQKIFGG